MKLGVVGDEAAEDNFGEIENNESWLENLATAKKWFMIGLPTKGGGPTE